MDRKEPQTLEILPENTQFFMGIYDKYKSESILKMNDLV